MIPLFTYLAMVFIHTPNPDMIFYECQNTGKVVDYHIVADRKIEYDVVIDCHQKRISIRLSQENLRHMKRDK